MKNTYTVEILDFDTIDILPNAWNDQNYIDLLNALDFGDISALKPSELKEMTMMALADNELNEAAKVLLDYIFEERLNEGQKDNLTYEMQDEKMWEEYAEISMHEEFFNIGQLLYQSYNGKFPHPDAAQFQLKISAKKKTDLEIFNTETETNLMRLMTQGMPPNTLINRLYKEELQGEDFEEAENIIWQLKEVATEENSITFDVISSMYWFHDLKFVEGFEAILEVE
ncbi:hypothetical protein [Rasiella sp. SM2506]|uniref:hypothetical protein n=1 Tax=Rasiella sp. SM2506 TaxID=3423914 RepID=UPI003D7B0B5F